MNTRWGTPVCSPLLSSMYSLVLAALEIDAKSNSTFKIEELPRASPPPGMSISTIPTGVIESRAALAFSGGSYSDLRHFALCAVLVRHPSGDLLFDTGIGKNWQTHFSALPWLMRKATKVKPGIPAAQQLLAHGYSPSNLAGIVLTHSHWDHISGVEDFSSVPVWMTNEEISFVDSGHRSTAVARSIGTFPKKPYLFADGPYLGFSSSHDVWADGSVVLVPAPGHTPGSVIAFIALPSGHRIALIGDIVWQMEGVGREVPKPWLSRMIADYSPGDVQRLIHALAHLQATRPEIKMIPSHDERAMNLLPIWPKSLS